MFKFLQLHFVFNGIYTAVLCLFMLFPIITTAWMNITDRQLTDRCTFPYYYWYRGTCYPHTLDPSVRVFCYSRDRQTDSLATNVKITTTVIQAVICQTRFPLLSIHLFSSLHNHHHRRRQLHISINPQLVPYVSYITNSSTNILCTPHNIPSPSADLGALPANPILLIRQPHHHPSLDRPRRSLLTSLTRHNFARFFPHSSILPRLGGRLLTKRGGTTIYP